MFIFKPFNSLFMRQLFNGLLVLLMLSATANAAAPHPKPTKMNVLQHVVLFKFKPETTPEKIAELIAGFEALPSKIKEIKSFQWGTNNSPEKRDKGMTHAFILTFDNEKGRDAYLPHPAHQAFGAQVLPWLEDLTVVDFVNRGGPRRGGPRRGGPRQGK